MAATLIAGERLAVILNAMLIKLAILKRIKRGEITLAFRRWQKPTVKSGGRLRTAVGELAIKRVVKTTVRTITASDARLAGFDSKAALMAQLGDREGDCYRIELAYAGADGRVALREDDALGGDELADLLKRLDRMDARAVGGVWTESVLAAIRDHPKLVSTELAETLGVERDWLKPNIRKLKNLGLTISHDVGYTLSPRGRKVLARMTR